MDLANNLGFIGLARKAGALEVGSEAAETAVAKGRAKLVIVSSDAGRSTVGKLTELCEAKGVPIRISTDKVTLGKALGRRMVAVAAVTDRNFADKMLKD